MRISPIVTCCIVIVLIISIILLILHDRDISGQKKLFHFGEEDTKYKSCTTLPCLELNDIISENMNPDVDPCEDFYNYACGNYVKTLEETDEYGTNLDHLKDEANKKFAELVAQPITSADNILSEHIKMHYSACLNPKLLNKTLRNKYINFPTKLQNSPFINVVNEYQDSTFNWIKLYKLFMGRGIPMYSIIKIDLELREDNMDKKFARIGKGSAPSMIGIGVRTEKRAQIEELVRDTGFKFIKDYLSDMESAFNVYDDIANLQKAYSDEPKRRRIIELQRKCEGVDWLNVTLLAFETSAGIDQYSEITVVDESYLCQLKGLFERHSKRAIAQFMYFTAYDSVIKEYEKFIEAASLPDNEQKKQRCIELIIKTYPIAASYLYMFHEEQTLKSFETSNDLISLFKLIRRSVMTYVSDSTWIPSAVKYKYIEKLKAIEIHKMFAPLDEFLERTVKIYEKAYQDMIIVDYEPLHNSFQVSIVNHKENGKKQLRDYYDFMLAGTNASIAMWPYSIYIPNFIALTNAILGPVTYLHGTPMFHNLGGIGFIIGHEFTHAVLSPFLNFDVSRKDVRLWKRASYRELQKRLNCLIEAYSNETDPCSGMKIDGSLTLIENGPDLGGVYASRKRLEMWLSDHKDEQLPMLPGFTGFTYEQMYWLSQAQPYCGRMKEDHCRFLVKNNPYTINSVRVNMNAKMSDYFGKDWNCQPGSPMNPELKCKIY